jgi:hypothetical protein
MLDSIALNVIISLVFIYSLYSLLITTLNEGIAAIFNLRAKTLEKGIKRMLTDNGDKKNTIVNQFYQQPIVKFLGETNNKKPSYLSSKTFAEALIHLCKKLATGVNEAEKQLLVGIQKIKEINPETGKYLEIVYQDTEGNIKEFQKVVENWFNETMDRATGWYKKQTQKITLIIALVLVLSFNVNTIGIIKNLSKNPKSAFQVLEMADKYAKASKSNLNIISDKETNNQIKIVLEKTQNVVSNNIEIQNANAILGLGWTKEDKKNIGENILGCLITALAISLGAPFWFDLLNKLMQLRGSKKNESTKV